MKVHFIPQYNEAEFNRIVKHADAYYASQRERATMMETVEHRNALLRERYNLRTKPRRTPDEDRRMEELNGDIKELMLEIGRKTK